MRKIMLSWTLVLAVAGLTLMSCKKDKNENPEPPKESTVKDERDGKEYKTIKIGDQTWFAENLRFSGSIAAGNIIDPYLNADSSKKYGKMYDWQAAMLACPKGWHLPSDSEWKLLEHNLGMSNADTTKFGFLEKRGVDQSLGTKLQAGGDSGFNFVIMAAENEQDVWSSTTFSGDDKYIRSFSRNDKSVYRAKNVAGSSLCVRCLQD